MTFEEELEAARIRKAEYIKQHGEEAWKTHIAELKRRSNEEHERQEIESLSMLRIERSGLADCIERMTFSTFTTREQWQQSMKNKCLKFIQQTENKWLFIGGPPGCGKTHLGTAVCTRHIKAGRPTRYTTFAQLMIELRSNANDDDEYERILNEYGRCEVLYIDDFMKFEPSESDKKHAFELLNMRYVRGGITIITSERHLSDVMKLDEALGSRIKQMCGEYAINIAKADGRNFRI